MTASGVAQLRRRWTGERLAAVQDQVVQQSRIVKGPHQFSTDWPETEDGLLDLRGVNAGRDGLQFRFVTVQGADFGHARGRLMFFESELSDCVFDSVTLSGQPRFDRSFVRCSFRGAKARGLAMGTQVSGCDFTGADLQKMRSLPNTRFEGCAFDDVDLSGATFADTTFIDCTFTGANFSASTGFTRCTFVRTPVVFGLARVTSTRRDGEALPDQWDGEDVADAAREAYAQRYAAAVATGKADDLDLDPPGEG